jgi:hypothetical protein
LVSPPPWPTNWPPKKKRAAATMIRKDHKYSHYCRIAATTIIISHKLSSFVH